MYDKFILVFQIRAFKLSKLPHDLFFGSGDCFIQTKSLGVKVIERIERIQLGLNGFNWAYLQVFTKKLLFIPQKNLYNLAAHLHENNFNFTNPNYIFQHQEAFSRRRFYKQRAIC